MTTLTLDVQFALSNFKLNFAHRLPLQGITALFGPSGSGKSSLLRIIAGLEKGATGHIRFGEEIWLDRKIFVKPERRGVGYVFQEALLFPHRTVEGNLRYAQVRSRRIDSPIHFDDVIKSLDLQSLMTRYPNALSGGERQRVAMGRTLLTRPRLLLMDEPLSALDLKRKGDILPYIERLPEHFGVPIIYVTHALEEVTRLAQEMIVLSAGRKAADGSVQNLFERLDLQEAFGRFEAGVVLYARVIEHDRTYQLTRLELIASSGLGPTITMPLAPVILGDEVRLRVRARDVSLATEKPSGISVRNIIPGVIRQIMEEPQTAFAEVLVDIGCAGLRARITRAAVTDLSLTSGKPVFALVKSIAFDHRILTTLS